VFDSRINSDLKLIEIKIAVVQSKQKPRVETRVMVTDNG